MTHIQSGMSIIPPHVREEWRRQQGHGLTSAIGEYTPREFWMLLDAYDALITHPAPAPTACARCAEKDAHVRELMTDTAAALDMPFDDEDTRTLPERAAARMEELATVTADAARVSDVQEMERELIAAAERYYDASSGSVVPFSQRIHALALIERGVRDLREARDDAARAGAQGASDA